MSIPVYGLSGIGGEMSHISDGRSFSQYAARIADSRRRAAITEAHRSSMRGLEGIYNEAVKKIATGTGTAKDAVDLKKARVLIALADTDYDAYRLASIYMPYVIDIDDKDGGYIFPTKELADVAAWGEEQVINYLNRPGANEHGLQGLLSKLKKAVSNVASTVSNAVKTTAKAVANTATAAVKSTVNAAKATGNLLAAAGKAVTGNTSGAKSSLQSALNKMKAAAVDPLKQAASDTKALTQATVVNPTKTLIQDTIDITKETVKIAGKVFKVLFIKINPVTILIRSSLRGLMSLNFLGMATRLGVGLMSKADALSAGYSEKSYNEAVKALEKFKKLFKKMGGNTDKLVKSIKNGQSKKPLFSKDIRPGDKIKFANGDDGETTLGDPATVAAMVAACVGILTSIWSWIKNIVSEKKAEQKQKEAEEEERRKREEWAELYEVDVNGNPIVDQYGQPIPKGQIAKDKAAAAAAAAGTGEEKKSSVWPWLIAGVVVVGGGILLMSNKKKGRRK